MVHDERFAMCMCLRRESIHEIDWSHRHLDSFSLSFSAELVYGILTQSESRMRTISELCVFMRHPQMT